MVVGQIGGIKVDPMVRVVFFDLFLFATGYKVGPQFFRGLGRQALAQASLTVVLCVTSLGMALLAARVMHYDMGTAAGLMAGAFTESTVIGTAGDAIRRLSLPAAEETRLLNNIPVAYAVSYLVGTTFVVWMLSSLAPRLLRIDIRKEARELDSRSLVARRGRTPSRRSTSGFVVRTSRATAYSSAGRSARSRRPSRRSASSSSGPVATARSARSGPTSASARTMSSRSPAGAVPSSRRRRRSGPRSKTRSCSRSR